MFVVGGVVVQGSVVVEHAVAVHGLVQAVPGALQGGAELAVAAGIGARRDGVDVGQCTFDLVEDQARVVGRERACAPTLTCTALVWAAMSSERSFR